MISAIGENYKKKLKDIEAGMNLKIVFETNSDSGKIAGFDWAYECRELDFERWRDSGSGL